MRIVGTDIPQKKKIGTALTYIYGIGPAKSLKILKEASISPDKRTSELSVDEVNRIRKLIESDSFIEGNLRRIITINIKRLRDIGSYRGARHMHSLPSRGQRTKTNSRTRRGNVRRTMGSGRRKAEKK